jgi:hypothetical protein
VIGVEVGRRGQRATGHNDHNQCEPKTIHRATVQRKSFRFGSRVIAKLR